MEKTEERLIRIVYPYIGISKDMLEQVILFTAPRTGMNINGKGWPIGKTSNGWDEDGFVPYYGILKFNNGKPLSTEGQEHSINLWEAKS